MDEIHWEERFHRFIANPVLWITIGIFLVLTILILFGAVVQMPADAPTLPQPYGPWGFQP